MVAVTNVPISEVVPGDNDRKVFSGIEELAANIADNGLAQPITVRPWNGSYQIVAGERRYRAIKSLGWETIPAIVRELDDEQAAAVMLAENLAREDLDPITEARAYRARKENFGWSEEKCAEKAGVNVRRVQDRMELLELPSDIQHLVASRQLPLGHAQLLGKIDHNRQRNAVRAYSQTPMTKSEFSILVRKLYEEQVDEASKPLFDLQEFVRKVKEQDEAADPLAYVPVDDCVPDPDEGGRNGTIFVEQYIVDLLEQGHDEAAVAVGKAYRVWVLVKGYAQPGPHESPLRHWLLEQEGKAS